MKTLLQNLWFQDPIASYKQTNAPVFINDTAVRIRAGFLLAIPVFLLFTLFDSVYTSTWVVDGNTAVDTYD